ncbi:ankyrin repeat domain-containing protein [Desulfovibrio caledoniensis]
MRKLCMTVALVLGLCLVAGAQDPAPAEHLKAIGRAADLIPTDPRAAEAALAEFEDNLAIAWRMYIVFTTRPESPERDKLLDEMAARLVGEIDHPKYPYLPKAIRSLKDVLEYVMAAYINVDVYSRPCAPLWLFRRHPEAMEATWAETKWTGYLVSSRQVYICRVPDDQDPFHLPEVNKFKSWLESMDSPSGAYRGTLERWYGMGYYRWEISVCLDVRRVGSPDPSIGTFLSLWSNQGIWEKLLTRGYEAQRTKTVAVLAKWLAAHNALSPEDSAEYAGRIADVMTTRVLGRYPKALLNTAQSPWYRYAVSGEPSGSGLEAIMPDSQTELNYMLQVSVLNHRPLNEIRALREAGATLRDAFENEAILAVDDPDYLEGVLSLGADVEHANPFGKTALMYAVQFGYTESARVLLDHGADVNRVTVPLKSYGEPNPFWRLVPYSVSSVRSPLVYACEQGNLESVRLLLDHGADRSLRFRKVSPEQQAATWLKLLDRNPVMTPAEKEIARHLLAGE